MNARLALWFLRVLALAPLWLAAADAVARVGGGEGYGRPSGGSGGGGSSGGGEGLGDLIFFLVWLCIEFPLIGIPLVLLVMAVVVLRFLFSARSGGAGVRTTARTGSAARPAGRVAPKRDLDAITKVDPGFSLTVLLDFLVLVHRRAWEAARTGQWENISPYVAESARAALVETEGWTLLDVIPGAIRPHKAENVGGNSHLQVRFETTRVERSATGREQRFLVEEEWSFRRKLGAITREPALVTRLGCPSCGNAVEGTRDGACLTCGTAISAGEIEWQAHTIRILSRMPVEAPPVSFWSGGDEAGTTLPSISDPGLSAAHRALHARHPDFDDTVFQRHVELVFQTLQSAWSDGKWQNARPFVTDPLYQTLRFQIERYTENGLRNRLEDVTLSKAILVKIATDAWYETIGVRLWASAKDSVVRVDTGEVIGGNAKIDRQFSEYWTFVRAAGTGGGSNDQKVCPSCAAPLDNVNAAGVCGYCDSKITTGRFDWVLSRIEQPEAYRG